MRWPGHPHPLRSLGMTMTTGSNRDLKDLLEGHHSMQNAIEDLKGFLDEPRPGVGKRGSHSWAAGMAEKLMQLHDRLFRHFRAEEMSESLRDLSVNRPHIHRSFEALRLDHDRILADLRSILGAAMIYSEGKPPENPQLRRWALSVLDRLSRHEHEETELFQRVLYHDTGAVD